MIYAAFPYKYGNCSHISTGLKSSPRFIQPLPILEAVIIGKITVKDPERGPKIEKE